MIANMQTKVADLPQIAEGLTSLGLAVSREDDHLVVPMQDEKGKRFAATLHVRDNNLVIACQLATLADIKEDDLQKAMYAALASNTEILPFALGILPSDDDRDSIVLINSVPLGDLALSELQAAMNSLRQAIHLANDVMPFKSQGCSGCCEHGF